MLAHSLLAKRKSGTVVGSSGKGKLLDDTNKPQQLSRSISVNELNMSGSKNASAMNVSRSRHASISMKQGGPSFHCNGEDDQFDHNPATAHDDERTEQEYTDSQLHDIDEVVAFLRKRAAIEEEYGRSMIKLSQSILGGKADDGKTGTYAEAWKHTLNLHENIGDIRLKFASSISAIADEVSTLHKNTERSRKQLKEAGYKHWKAVHESENCLEKSKKKYEGCSEDWEHALLIRETVQKQEEDARTRAAIANENYKQQLATTNTLRSNYFQIHLPRFIRMLLQTNETCDHGLQLQLIKHAHDMESMLLAEATLLSPVESDKLESGIVRTLEKIDNSSDFHQYMAAYFHNCKYFQKCDHQYSPYSMSPEAFSLANPKPVFGVDLSEVTVRDNIQVPLVVQKCIAAVEKDGLRIPGLYRVSAANHAVQKLRSQFNKDSELVDLGEWEDDISVVSSALKLYFRELPDSLFPKSMYHAFIDAARQSDECNRLISIHELVNQLNDAHYSTLQVLIGHLHNVQQLEAENRMGVQNLAIVWGPTLLDSPHDPMVAGGFDPSELRLQSKVVETILANYGRIFEL
ncbi:hypothetical protein HDU84_005828 [Entophlyctis sp. JEL0112]|nr:hypothetical protein HDU84_005828 [Entophlyctis sp. JEL0112]